jgi:hypothetical protein
VQAKLGSNFMRNELQDGEGIERNIKTPEFVSV